MELRSQEKFFENIVKKIKDSEMKEVEVNLDDAIKKGMNLKYFMNILDRNEKWVVDILINLFDKNGNTLLHLAVSEKNSDAVKNLLEKGADLLISNHKGKLPSRIAYEEYGENEADPELRKIIKIFEATLYSATSKPAKKALHGYIFQTRLLMLCVLYADENNLKFRLFTEFDEAECFDDIVFETIESDKKIYRFIQAKHKLNTNTEEKITYGDFTKKPGEGKDDFSIVKYFQGFIDIRDKEFFKPEHDSQSVEKYFILATNTDFSPRAFSEINKYIDPEKGDALFINDVLLIPDEAKKYQFNYERTTLMNIVKEKMIKNTVNSFTSDDDELFVRCNMVVESLEELENETKKNFNTFLNNFRFITNLPNEKKLEKLIMKKIEKKFINKNRVNLNTDVVNACFQKEMFEFLYKGNKNEAMIYTNKRLDEFIIKLQGYVHID